LYRSKPAVIADSGESSYPALVDPLPNKKVAEVMKKEGK